MKLHQLRTFVAIVGEGSFVAAARVLGVAQPGISKQVAQLERELDARLFVRSASGVTLTEAGSASDPRVHVTVNDVWVVLNPGAAGS